MVNTTSHFWSTRRVLVFDDGSHVARKLIQSLVERDAKVTVSNRLHSHIYKCSLPYIPGLKILHGEIVGNRRLRSALVLHEIATVIVMIDSVRFQNDLNSERYRLQQVIAELSTQEQPLQIILGVAAHEVPTVSTLLPKVTSNATFGIVPREDDILIKTHRIQGCTSALSISATNSSDSQFVDRSSAFVETCLKLSESLAARHSKSECVDASYPIRDKSPHHSPSFVRQVA